MDVYGDEVFWDCDSGCRGFESHRSPQFISVLRVITTGVLKIRPRAPADLLEIPLK